MKRLILIMLILIIGIFISLIYKEKISSLFLSFNITKQNNSKEDLKINHLPEVPNKEVIKIVAFGDSVTAGLYVNIEDAYPAQLEKKLNSTDLDKNYKVINMGISGETTFMALERTEFIKSQNADIIIVGLGGNDMLQSVAPQKVYDNLEKILSQIKTPDNKIVLLGMQSVQNNGLEYKKEFDSIYAKLAKKYNLTFVPFMLKGVALDPKYNNTDMIHPNAAGYAVVVENILKYLEKELFLKL